MKSVFGIVFSEISTTWEHLRQHLKKWRKAGGKTQWLVRQLRSELRSFYSIH